MAKCVRFVLSRAKIILPNLWQPVFLGLLYVHIFIVKDLTLSPSKFGNPSESIPQLSRRQQQFGRHVGALPDHLMPPFQSQDWPLLNHNYQRQHLSAVKADTNILLAGEHRITVHFFWCGNRHFKFHNFLSVLSAVKILNPHQIHFHYSELPVMDRLGYYHYFPAILRDIPQLNLRPMETRNCHHFSRPSLTSILNILDAEGGVYIPENIILTESFTRRKPSNIRLPFSGNLEMSDFLRGTVIASSKFGSTQRQQTLEDNVNATKNIYACVNNGDLSSDLNAYACIFMNEEIFPVQIMTSRLPLASHLRWLSYGISEPAAPKPSNTTLVPNIAHYVWFGKRHMSVFNYLSLLSVLFVLRVDTVYIHGDHMPLGEYWLKAQAYGNVHFIYRTFPDEIWGNKVENPSHASDIVRADVLLRYGGVYLDWDVLCVQPIPVRLREFEFTTNVDSFLYPEGTFPDTLNLGIILAKPKARFLQFQLESMKTFVDTDWGFNGVDIPYKIYERHPDLVNIDRHLQVICYYDRCYPPYVRDSETVAGFKHAHTTSWNWETDTISVHWTYPDPVEFSSLSNVRQMNTWQAKVGQKILKLSQTEPS